jgi:hypothetical protein
MFCVRLSDLLFFGKVCIIHTVLELEINNRCDIEQLHLKIFEFQLW